MSDDIVAVAIPRSLAEHFANSDPMYMGGPELAEACRVALWTPKVGDMVQTRSGTSWFPLQPLEGVKGWRRVVVDVTDRHVVTRDTDTGQLGAALIEDIRLDERPEPEGGWNTDWWDEHKSDYLGGDNE